MNLNHRKEAFFSGESEERGYMKESADMEAYCN